MVSASPMSDSELAILAKTISQMAKSVKLIMATSNKHLLPCLGCERTESTEARPVSRQRAQPAKRRHHLCARRSTRQLTGLNDPSLTYLSASLSSTIVDYFKPGTAQSAIRGAAQSRLPGHGPRPAARARAL